VITAKEVWPAAFFAVRPHESERGWNPTSAVDPFGFASFGTLPKWYRERRAACGTGDTDAIYRRAMLKEVCS